jgi:ABC-type antimicrobial peptide transport system permease subunit
MMTEKTKTILLIIGVILACLLLFQGISLGLGNTLNVGSLQFEISSNAIADLFEIRKAGFKLF